jgi:hypothetical protein
MVPCGTVSPSGDEQRFGALTSSSLMTERPDGDRLRAAPAMAEQGNLALADGRHAGLPESAGGTGSQLLRAATGGRRGVIAGRSGRGCPPGRPPIA